MTRQIRHLLILLLLPTIFIAQNYPDLNSKTRSTVVESISQLLLDDYVFPDTAVKMTKYIKKRLKDGAYNKINNPVTFGSAIIEDLFTIHRDLHLQISYNPAREQQPPPTSNAIRQKNDEPFKKERQANFGFKQVEILNGNIGYINMTNFWADKVYGKETIKSALQFVSNTNAIIFDIRNNSGGLGECVSLILSPFFKDKIHVTDYYNRYLDATTSSWTTPDSSFTQLINIPVYVLTSKRTFSAAEEFAYDLQCLKRATIVGEVTGGGAHPVIEKPIGQGYFLMIPCARAINPVTKSNWEAVGVKPDLIVSADKALETSEMKIFETLFSTTKDSSDLFNLKWQLDFLKAANNPITIDSVTLKKYVGVYGDRIFTFKEGKLYYDRVGKSQMELEAITPTIMRGKGNMFFKIEFIANAQGQVDQLKAHYQDRRVEKANRTQ